MSTNGSQNYPDIPQRYPRPSIRIIIFVVVVLWLSAAVIAGLNPDAAIAAAVMIVVAAESLSMRISQLFN